jgi:hypothetical protein
MVMVAKGLAGVGAHDLYGGREFTVMLVEGRGEPENNFRWLCCEL